MLTLKQGKDILSTLGGVENQEEAVLLFEKTLDRENLEKLKTIGNKEALLKIANALALTRPDSVFIHSGTEEDRRWIREQSLKTGEESSLAKKDHTIHFDLPEDQGRLVNNTAYIVNPGEKISTLARKELRDSASDHLGTHMTGIMKGMIMMVGFYSRGPVGAQGSIPALEITSSAYVIHSADILYRNCFDRFDTEAKRYGLFFTNLHSQGRNRPEDIPDARIYMDRSWLTTYSLYCTYAGNTLLLKKGNHRFAVDIATYLKRGRELSEHMFITGISGPGGRRTYIAGAAPSGCGKTTTAMVGSDFIGDDLAQMWIDENGTCRAVNPEKGIFGIVEDLNRQGDPHLMDCLRGDGAEVIWSNVLVDEKGVPHWTGNGEEPPTRGRNHQGEWFQGKTDQTGRPLPLSHPNSRCTLENIHIANYNAKDAEDPAGVQIKVVTYSGRDSDTLPPVWVARNPDHGVALGASIVSKATATEQGATGVNRQPWANAPFIPGPLADHMDAQFRFFNSRLFTGVGRPIMAGLNYFLTHESRGSEGSGLLGEKRDVKVWLQWLDRYVHGEAAALDTPIGSIPLYKDLKKLFAGIGKEYSRDLYRMQFSLYIDNILRRINLQIESYQKEEGVTQRLFAVYEEQKEGLERLKEWFGPIVTPEQLESRGDATPRIPRKVWNLTA